ncbi:surface protease GP63 [Trypanosoma cruzi]|nr:surface protease GP63 [Trypanosoma cruzi]
MGCCPVTDSALDVRDIEGVIWRGEYSSAVPGDEPSSWPLKTLPANTKNAREPEETRLSAAAMHAALNCLCIQVHLRVTEKGNVRWAPCTDGATIKWATRLYDEGNAVCRDHAGVCRISVTGGSILLVVPWDGEERAWSRTVSPASTEQGLPGGIRRCCREHWDWPWNPIEEC